MNVQLINSSKNEQYKQLLKLKQKKYRYREEVFLIEGIKFVKHALTEEITLQTLIFCSDLIDKASKEDILEMLLKSSPQHGEGPHVKILDLSKDLFEELSDTVNSQGVIAVVAFPKAMSTFDSKGLYLALDRIQDPGNLGTLIRTADAAGFSGVILSKGTVDPFSEKVLRSTMGSVFSMPLYFSEALEETLEEAKSLGLKVYCTALEDSIDYTDADFEKGSVIVIGNEAQGIGEAVFTTADYRITIPILGQAESLNAAVAGAIVMYEAVNQRRKVKK